MPFFGRLNNTTVIPEDVDDGVTVRCLECDGPMAPRGPFEDGRARHFHHITSTNENCSGGESDPHRKMKSLAVSTLRQQFPDHTQCNAEITLEVADTATLPDTRRADAFLEFTTPNRYYGNGIIIEIQYRNHGKDLFATTHDYLSLDYSVYWATPADFTDDQFPFTPIESKFNNQENDAYATYHYDPDEFSTELAASLHWEDPTSCDHSWQDIDDATPAYESCATCGTNRIYDEDRTRYLYDDTAILGEPAEPTSGDNSQTDGCTSRGHVWEPLDNGVYRCAHCNVRKVSLYNGWGQEAEEIVLPMWYMGKDLTELTSNPEQCSHNWQSKRETHQCGECGLIDDVPY